jgi:hypothetical protein
MSKIVKYFVFSILFSFINTAIADNEQFYQNNTYGQLEQINAKVKNNIDSSWTDLSKQLQKMSETIQSNPNLPKMDTSNFKNLWLQSIIAWEKDVKDFIDSYIKKVSIEGEKSDFNDPLIVSELSQLKRFDFSYAQYLLKKMSECNFEIYSGFWEAPLKLYTIDKNVFASKKTAFLFILLKKDIAIQPPKFNSNTVILLLNAFSEMIDSNTAKRLMTLYNETDNKEVHLNIINHLDFLLSYAENSNSKAIIKDFIEDHKSKNS